MPTLSSVVAGHAARVYGCRSDRRSGRRSAQAVAAARGGALARRAARRRGRAGRPRRPARCRAAGPWRRARGSSVIGTCPTPRIMMCSACGSTPLGDLGLPRRQHEVAGGPGDGDRDVQRDLVGRTARRRRAACAAPAGRTGTRGRRRAPGRGETRAGWAVSRPYIDLAAAAVRASSSARWPSRSLSAAGALKTAGVGELRLVAPEAGRRERGDAAGVALGAGVQRDEAAERVAGDVRAVEALVGEELP